MEIYIFNTHANFTYFLYAIAVLTILILWNVYNVISKKISIASGENHAVGSVTYSEHHLVKGHPNTHYETLISYKYYVEGSPYAGKFYKKSMVFNKKHSELSKNNPIGKQINIYYSLHDFDFSTFGEPPSKLSVYLEVIKYNLIIWVLLFTIISSIILAVLN